MSTSSYNSDERTLLPAEILVAQDLPKESPETDECHGLQPSFQASLHDANSIYDRSKAPDEDLITAAQRGDQQAFTELCERYSSYTRRKIFGIVRNQEDAEDALQDTLLRAYTHLASFRRSCKFSTWLTTIGVNSALMIMRKRRGRRATLVCAGSLDEGTPEIPEPCDRSLGPEGTLLEQEAAMLVRQEVERLQPTLRAAVNHYYVSEGSLAESAEALEISLSAVKSRLSRGRARLRSSLAGYGICEPRK